MSLLEKALWVALEAHRGAKDKAGAPYILHPLRVMLAMHTEQEMLAALLHDVVEDSPLTPEDLLAQGFPPEVVEAVVHLTRRPEEDYGGFIGRVGGNLLARKVKLADLADNMDIRRLEKVEEREAARLAKYLAAWRYLSTL